MLLILTTDLLHSLHSPWRDPQQYIPYSQKVVFCWDHLFTPVTVTVTHNKNFHHCINTAERKYHKFNSKFLTLPYIFTIHFMPLVSFYIPERIKKPVVSFPIFLGGIERDQCNEIGWIELFFTCSDAARYQNLNIPQVMFVQPSDSPRCISQC